MNRFAIFALLLIICSNAANAAKLYKIVDEKGNVSFSQYPPQQATKAAKVEDLTIASNGAATQVTSKGRNQYCGDISLLRAPTSQYSKQRFAEKLDRQQQRWQDDIQRLNRDIDEMSRSQFNRSHNKRSYQNSSANSYQNSRDSNYQQRLADKTERLRDLRCALKWAKQSTQQIPQSADADRGSEKDRLLGIKQELQQNLDRVCGVLPPFDPTDKVAEAKRKAWYKCSSDFRQKISLIERKINQL